MTLLSLEKKKKDQNHEAELKAPLKKTLVMKLCSIITFKVKVNMAYSFLAIHKF